MVDPSVGKRNLFAAQSRGNKLKQVLTEYGREVTAAIPVGYQHIEKLLQEFQKVPTYPSSIALGVYTGRMEEEVKHLSLPDRRRGTLRSSHSWDPKDPADFIKDAHEIGHPRRAFARVPALMREVLEEVFLSDPLRSSPSVPDS